MTTEKGDALLAGDSRVAQRRAETLAVLEDIIAEHKRGFLLVAAALLRIRDEQLYVDNYRTFEQYCRKRWDFGASRARQLIAAAEVAGVLDQGATAVTPESERQLRPLAGMPAEEAREVWAQAVDEADGEQPTGPQVEAAAAKRKKGDREALHSSATVEWYTPHEYIAAAHDVMGGIDVDPASSRRANETVRATKYFTVEDDGFNLTWRGRVWLNPPYGRTADQRSEAGRWLTRLFEKHDAGEVHEAMALVSSAIGQPWFEGVWSWPVCFPDRRIRMLMPDGKPGPQPTNGSAVLYVGPPLQWQRFVARMRGFGPVCVPSQKRELGNTDGGGKAPVMSTHM